MEDVKTVVCRLCLKFTSIDECQALDAVSKDILKAVVPGVDLEVSHDPKLCQTCYKTMLRCYRFKTNCKKDKTEFKKKSSTIEGEEISTHSEEIEKKCGFCCDTIDNESLENFNARKIYFDEVLQNCLPEWNLSGSMVPCKKCLETLTDQYTFIGSCLDTEDKLKHYRSSQGTNSDGKFNLYEAVRYFSLEENKESGSMTETDEEMPYDDLGSKIKEEIQFPEFDLKTENIETEDVDIKSEASDEEFIGNIATSTSDISERGEASGSVQQPKGSQCKRIVEERYNRLPEKRSRTSTFEANYKIRTNPTINANNILKEHNFGPIKRRHKALPLLEEVADGDRNHIRRIVHSFFTRHEQPTLEKIQDALNKDERLPRFPKTILARILNEINFRFKGKTQNKFLKEKDETIIWRRRYLCQIKKYRNEGRPIYYIDETSVDIGQDSSSSSKDKRFAVLHVGSDEGFVEGELLFLKSNKNKGDETKTTLFEEWFGKILSKLKDNAVIVLHKSSCHERPLEKFPGTGTSKVDIRKWLTRRGVPFEDDMVRVELLALVKKMKPNAKQYVIDEKAKADGKTVLWLPPFHSELNPLEMIWAQIRENVVGKSGGVDLKDVRSLLVDAVAGVSVDDWKKAVDNVKKVEEELWQLDIDMERQIESLMVNCSGTESETESE